ncbi:ATP-dependent DNA ligase [Desertibacillus haloalkaliphilus]|uniref:ATP-dependent DNA ligase n=1 Tax=Desertibacillus haloalkaliphilus TaxID=1328930 RepID=UPI001C267111|nr:RNA ligase family protein [Desertibacillus haloalkaliphilus]MBU8908148.1 ATP-dependent DNA ligase [Desertibacillus haloalkaliphilus]
MIRPMLLEMVNEPFEDDNKQYAVELKMDGFRAIYSTYNSKVSIYTRHQNDVTTMFDEKQILSIPSDTILDGEIIALDNQGKPDFEAVMRRFRTRRYSKTIPVQYVVFDVIYYKGKQVTSLPYLERKALLDTIIPQDTNKIAKIKWMIGNGKSFFNLCKENQLEGCVFKDIHSTYEIGKRSSSWLKCINYSYLDVIITGYKKGVFGLILSDINDKRFLGVMEFMPTKDRKQFYQMVKDMKKEEKDQIAYIYPGVSCRVKYRNLTKNGLLRIPSFVEFL